ncbi:hypothetical protein ACWIGM_05340 [Bosea sp. NPDC055332]
MSAVAIFLESDAAWLATDGLTYRYGEGRVETIQQKAYPLVHLSCAVTVRGPQAYAHQLIPVLNSRFASFDDLVAGLPLAAWAIHEEIKDELGERYGNPHVEVYVVGWSHGRGQAEGYALASHAAWGEPWHRLEADRFACAPGVVASNESDIAAAAVDVVQRQRLERDEYGHCGVGGFLQLTQVTPEAVHSAIVHRWADDVGETSGMTA